MCGIAGFLGGRRLENAEATIRSMTAALSHRGPDQQSVVINEVDNQILCLGHARLAVVDLSPAGAQPMHSACKRFTLVFNGEIFNHLELRQELQRQGSLVAWRGNSDTETLLACISRWGLEGALKATVGMFALGLWDKKERSLYLARDRIGEKPLYYGWQGRGSNSTFMFASEIKSLRQHTSFDGCISRRAVFDLMMQSYIHGEQSIYDGIKKLKPGTILCIRAGKSDHVITDYFSIHQVIDSARHRPIEATFTEAVDELDKLIRRSVALQVEADVPVGAFLSGGIDSSLIAAVMQDLSPRAIKTFTMGFEDEQLDEAPHARKVADYLGTDHTEMYITEHDLLSVIPTLSNVYCEPFADPSQIPTLLLSKLTSRAVTVSLSGDAGDELFFGYSTYKKSTDLWAILNKIPLALRGVAKKSMSSVPTKAWYEVARICSRFDTERAITLSKKMEKSVDLLASESLEALFIDLTSHWNPDVMSVPDGLEEWSAQRRMPEAWPRNDASNMAYSDLMAYLPDDILVKVDRAAMAFSLETRVPLLDHRIVCFALGLPMSYKVGSLGSKHILRSVLSRYVPVSLTDRPKKGFGVPLASWLRGPLKEWAASLLDESHLDVSGMLNSKVISRKWQQHLSGKADWSGQLWVVLCFQAWLLSEK